MHLLEKDGEKSKKKGKPSYCRKFAQLVPEGPKLNDKEAKKKEVDIAIADVSPTNAKAANLVHHVEWAFDVECFMTPLSMMHI